MLGSGFRAGGQGFRLRLTRVAMGSGPLHDSGVSVWPGGALSSKCRGEPSPFPGLAMWWLTGGTHGRCPHIPDVCQEIRHYGGPAPVPAQLLSLSSHPLPWPPPRPQAERAGEPGGPHWVRAAQGA